MVREKEGREAQEDFFQSGGQKNTLAAQKSMTENIIYQKLFPWPHQIKLTCRP